MSAQESRSATAAESVLRSTRFCHYPPCVCVRTKAPLHLRLSYTPLLRCVCACAEIRCPCAFCFACTCECEFDCASECLPSPFRSRPACVTRCLCARAVVTAVRGYSQAVMKNRKQIPRSSRVAFVPVACGAATPSFLDMGSMRCEGRHAVERGPGHTVLALGGNAPHGGRSQS